MSLAKELESYRDSDPDVIAAEKEEIEVCQVIDSFLEMEILKYYFVQEAVSGVNRWTDNVDNLRSWVRSKFNMSDADFVGQTGIPEEWEYVEVEPKA